MDIKILFKKISIKKIIFLLTIITIVLSGCSNNKLSEKEPNNIPENIGNVSGNLSNMGYIVQDNFNIYFSSKDNSESYLVKAEFDGNNKKKLYKGHIVNLNIYNGWIYFIDQKDFHLYKIDVDGNNLTEIISRPVSRVCIYKDYIYFLDSADWNLKIYDFKDNTIKNKINKNINNYFIHNDKIIYIIGDSTTSKTSFYTYNLNTEIDTMFYTTSNPVYDIYPYKNNIVYLSASSITIVDIESGNSDNLMESDFFIYHTSVNIDENNGCLYYSVMGDSFYKLDIESKKIKKISNIKVEFLHLINNRIFYYDKGNLLVINDKNGKSEIFGDKANWGRASGKSQ